MASQSITIRLLTAGINAGNFTINQWAGGATVAVGVSRPSLLNGVTYWVNVSSTYITLQSNTLLCNGITTLYIPEAAATTTTSTTTTTTTAAGYPATASLSFVRYDYGSFFFAVDKLISSGLTLSNGDGALCRVWGNTDDCLIDPNESDDFVSDHIALGTYSTNGGLNGSTPLSCSWNKYQIQQGFDVYLTHNGDMSGFHIYDASTFSVGPTVITAYFPIISCATFTCY